MTQRVLRCPLEVDILMNLRKNFKKICSSWENYERRELDCGRMATPSKREETIDSGFSRREGMLSLGTKSTSLARHSTFGRRPVFGSAAGVLIPKLRLMLFWRSNFFQMSSRRIVPRDRDLTFGLNADVQLGDVRIRDMRTLPAASAGRRPCKDGFKGYGFVIDGITGNRGWPDLRLSHDLDTQFQFSDVWGIVRRSSSFWRPNNSKSVC